MTITHKTTTHQALQNLLCRTLDFTADDMAANRQGRVTTAQAQRFAARSQAYNPTTQRFMLIFGAAAVVVLSGVVAIASSGPYVLVSLVILWVFLLFALVAIAGIARLILRQFHQKMLSDLAENRFEAVRGELRITSMETRISTVRWRYVLSVGDRAFWLTKEQYQRLQDSGLDGQQALVYYMPMSKWMILSVELLQAS